MKNRMKPRHAQAPLRSGRKYAHRPADTPKAQRRGEPVRPAPALIDPIRTLGHPARPRKRHGG